MADRDKLSLDDVVSKYLPELTEASNVTIRELLSHTSGYRDYFLQEYIPAHMQRPTSVNAILSTWAERPLDFPPGQQSQYSGTNYVIANCKLRSMIAPMAGLSNSSSTINSKI